MRPINLIPTDERRGRGAPKRGGPLAYVIVGALVLLLGGITLLVSAENEISSNKSEVAELTAENATAKARVSRLAAYTQLEGVRDERVATVTELADSRFDWERVMRELALIMPRDVWLTNMTGTDAPNVSVNGSSSIALRQGVAGPALEIIGCSTSQDAVAGFVSALKNIDGATRVAMQYSKLPEGEGGGESGSASASGGNCQTRPWIPEFQIVVAFDAAPVPTTSGTEESAAPEESESSTESSSEASPSSGEGG